MLSKHSKSGDGFIIKWLKVRSKDGGVGRMEVDWDVGSGVRCPALPTGTTLASLASAR